MEEARWSDGEGEVHSAKKRMGVLVVGVWVHVVLGMRVGVGWWVKGRAAVKTQSVHFESWAACSGVLRQPHSFVSRADDDASAPPKQGLEELSLLLVRAQRKGAAAK